VKTVIPLEKTTEESIFGAKAVGLGEATRANLPVPPGVALSGPMVDAIASGEEGAIKEVVESVRSLPGPFAVRSSCVDEDGAQASFAGQHLTVLNVPSSELISSAVKEIWWSANSDSAITYRQRVGLYSRPNVGVVVQALLDPEVAGVLFTRNPINGADERVIEGSWGLGEAVVSGRVIPDHFRIDRSGEVLERTAGVKQFAIRSVADGGTVDEDVAPELVEGLCLDDDQLELLNTLAGRCEEIYGPDRDIEWAFADGELYLLQCRAMTRSGSSPRPAAAPTAPIEVLQAVPLFADLDEREADLIALLFKERRFSAGETVAKEGTGAAAFFVIDSGEATVSIRGKYRATLKAGDFFGEIALIDDGARSATVTATSDLVCRGLNVWDFRPLVQQNAAISWKLLQALAKRLRTAQEE
jgi:pyruvate,water dikinase